MACFRLSRLLGVEDGFTVLQNLGEEPVRFAPCIQHSIVHSVSKDVFDRREQSVRYGGIMLWFDVGSVVAGSDPLDRRIPCHEIIGLSCNWEDGTEERCVGDEGVSRWRCRWSP